MVPRKLYVAELKAAVAELIADSDEVTLSEVESKLRGGNFKREVGCGAMLIGIDGR